MDTVELTTDSALDTTLELALAVTLLIFFSILLISDIGIVVSNPNPGIAGKLAEADSDSAVILESFPPSAETKAASVLGGSEMVCFPRTRSSKIWLSVLFCLGATVVVCNPLAVAISLVSVATVEAITIPDVLTVGVVLVTLLESDGSV